MKHIAITFDEKQALVKPIPIQVLVVLHRTEVLNLPF